ncbi:Uncharacterised protein [Mycobacteroides abscessus subsp. abscessus]|nr:Uncharacterised protein [Mycobacteroides abscessus subsp. abscessus]
MDSAEAATQRRDSDSATAGGQEHAERFPRVPVHTDVTASQPTPHAGAGLTARGSCARFRGAQV